MDHAQKWQWKVPFSHHCRGKAKSRDMRGQGWCRVVANGPGGTEQGVVVIYQLTGYLSRGLPVRAR